MADASLPFEPVTDRELVERDEVLDALSGLLAGATHQGGRLVLLAGEAGIGKTSVVVELTRMWADRSLVLMGACDPLDTPRPLSPLLDIAADPQSGITDLVAAGVTGYDLYGAMVERLGGTVRPTLVVVEDIHWADDATLDFLRYLGRRVENTTAVVVATYRDDELGARPDLRRLLGDLATRRDAVIRVTLAALSVEAVALLAGRAGADAAEAVSIHRRTGGNPFYVTEVLAAGAGLPATVQDSVLARTSRLDPEAHRVVETVSVAPRSLEPGELEALMPGAEEAADRAVAAGVLDFDGAALRFRHELARSAVEAALAPMRRIDLHRSMVNLLVARESTDLARIVHHAVVVGDDPLVRSFAPPAAEQAIARGSIREAVRFYQIAVDRADEADPRADLHARLALALGRIDRQPEAVEHARAAVELYRAAGDSPRLGVALSDLSSFLWRVGDRKASAHASAEAVRVLEPAGDSPELALALSRVGLEAMLRRHYAEAMAAGTRVLEIARRLSSTELECHGLLTTGTAELVTGDPDVGVATLQRGMGLSREVGNAHRRIRFLGMLGSGGGEVRRYAQAVRWLEEDIATGTEQDEDYFVAYDVAWLARIRFEQGRWDEATDLVARVPTDDSVARIIPMTSLGALGRTRVRRGDPGAEETLRHSLQAAPDAELQHRWPALCGLAELRWLQGRSEEAIDILTEPYAATLETDSPWAQGEVGFWMWRCGGIDRPPPLAAEPFALHIEGDWAAAADRWREIGCPYEEALALADGDGDAMLRALEIFVGLGARPAADLVRARLRESGDTAPRVRRVSTLRHPAGLTARQAEVLDLLGLGLTNRQIASRLFISPKTAEHHVAAILTKLGVGARSEAVAIARDGYRD